MTLAVTDPSRASGVLLSLDAVVIAVSDGDPQVLVVQGHGERDALPSGPLDLDRHQTLERGLRDWLLRQTALDVGYVEQLYTFGDRYRDPREADGGPRVVSAAYLSLVRADRIAASPAALFRPVYGYLPWEDWRRGRPALIDAALKPLLTTWADDHAARRERVAVSFGIDGAPWDPERTLERYELLWEAGLVTEAGAAAAVPASGRPLALDHRRMLAQALGRIRGKLRYRPVVFELLPEEFTLLALQRVVEALAGNLLHKQNFRRLVEAGGLVEGTGRFEHTGRGRPAELFRFRRDVLRERPAPGVWVSEALWARG
jgi:hypothetical protein